ncbi:hypothetical protein EGW08_012400 [Elysia chlorotica]|uniref:Receptor ligand binding region domain-containing protein n=1 Tax=Elysia chlorotica TaxID=188477 RepID=A0A433TE47_ELYCH|nr:hypothetical protein EGW08_012400 [Elysia chlorotica]
MCDSTDTTTDMIQYGALVPDPHIWVSMEQIQGEGQPQKPQKFTRSFQTIELPRSTQLSISYGDLSTESLDHYVVKCAAETGHATATRDPASLDWSLYSSPNLHNDCSNCAHSRWLPRENIGNLRTSDSTVHLPSKRVSTLQHLSEHLVDHKSERPFTPCTPNTSKTLGSPRPGVALAPTPPRPTHLRANQPKASGIPVPQSVTLRTNEQDVHSSNPRPFPRIYLGLTLFNKLKGSNTHKKTQPSPLQLSASPGFSTCFTLLSLLLIVLTTPSTLAQRPRPGQRTDLHLCAIIPRHVGMRSTLIKEFTHTQIMFVRGSGRLRNHGGRFNPKVDPGEDIMFVHSDSPKEILDIFCKSILGRNVVTLLNINNPMSMQRRPIANNYILEMAAFLGIPVISWDTQFTSSSETAKEATARFTEMNDLVNELQWIQAGSLLLCVVMLTASLKLKKAILDTRNRLVIFFSSESLCQQDSFLSAALRPLYASRWRISRLSPCLITRLVALTQKPRSVVKCARIVAFHPGSCRALIPRSAFPVPAAEPT